MSREDYRDKIEEHRQSIKVDQDQTNSRRARSKGRTTVQRKKRRDPLLTTLAIILVLIPLCVLIYFSVIWSPGTTEEVQNGNETVEFEENNGLPETDNNNEEGNVDDLNGDSEQTGNNEQSDNESILDSTDQQQNEEQNDVGQAPNNSSSPNNPIETNNGEQENNNENTNSNVHIVKVGDTLYSIATDNNTTVEQVMLINNLSSENIYVGQEIRLP
ncbi:hypothetical protein CD30_11805 [Ureibacillus massiliensis 4400831 = CIP 108448 = CCUG 49529]|uniref:LysM domain-containing protein n=1 Tax=Ureibacillus massiliensis 4400831 = CIP 108448 = CCUG 49529 TaxID=1211035 RepID=A0A0A3J0A8_9BACL|nr:LysM peptidoglycan-binding domain-containing protein [Ureibacillus massiliensis]KGR90366.1 hypothetical protein CD30_11805 [Ureibacillus massiliensis 4400831 = CIP 108448 = CCUG 49529]